MSTRFAFQPFPPSRHSFCASSEIAVRVDFVQDLSVNQRPTLMKWNQKISRALSYGVDKVTMFEAFFPKLYFVCKEERWNETQNSGRPTCWSCWLPSRCNLPVKYLEPSKLPQWLKGRTRASVFFSYLSSWTQINHPSWFNNHSWSTYPTYSPREVQVE